MILVELTVCFETNFDASLRKAEKYQDLLEACTANRYSTTLVTLEVGSRGFLNIHGFQKLFEHFSLSKQEKISLLKSITKDHREVGQLVIEILINCYIHNYIL